MTVVPSAKQITRWAGEKLGIGRRQRSSPRSSLPLAVEARIAKEVAAYTMLHPEALSATIHHTIATIDAGIEGDVVECGTWKGGASFSMLLAQRYKYGRIVKPIWMFDSFQGLPPADERDGPHALQYQKNTASPAYFDNCTAPLEGVREAIGKFGFKEDEAIVVPGWFNESIPGKLAPLARNKIALLRVDCDWYEPVTYVLDSLAPYVSDEGAIILDDYYAWDGCARATHDFLSRNDLSWRIKSANDFACAWMSKRDAR